MDTTKTTHISLCSGYGGIDLGLKRVLPNLRTIAYAEIEAFAIENLLARMEGGQLDAAPIWSNLKSFPWGKFSGLVDILSGGYPCQPFSTAGKRAGADDPRHLWPYISTGIALMRPRLCFFENVEGHISLGLPDVIEDLARLGYRTTWGIFSAAEVGAPHQRKRVFILAHRSNTGLQGREWFRQAGAQRTPSGHAAKCGGAVAVADSFGGATGFSGSFSGDEGQPGITNNGCPEIWPSRPGKPQYAWEPPRVVGNGNSLNRSAPSAEWFNDPETGQPSWRQTESSLGGNTHGPAGGLDYAELCVSCDNRTDELRLLGNGVVPATAERAFRLLLKELTAKKSQP